MARITLPQKIVMLSLPCRPALRTPGRLPSCLAIWAFSPLLSEPWKTLCALGGATGPWWDLADAGEAATARAATEARAVIVRRAVVKDMVRSSGWCGCCGDKSHPAPAWPLRPDTRGVD